MLAGTLVSLSLLLAMPARERPPEVISNSWVGKTVIVMGIGFQLANLDERGELTGPTSPLTGLDYRVLEERGNFIRIKTRESVVGWLDKKNVALVEEAIAHFTKRLEQDPNDVQALNHRGWAFSLKGEFLLGIKDMTEAIRISPELAYYNNRARIWVAKGDYDQALADYAAALNMGAQFHIPHYNRGVCWMLKKEYEKAIADFDRTLQLNPNFAACYRNRGLARLARGNYGQAIADLDEAIRRDPQDGPAYSARGSAWLAKKDYDKAIADSKTAIRLEPESADPFTTRGLAWAAKKEYAKAIGDFNEARWRAPKDARPVIGLAWLLATCPDEKIRDGKRALELAKEAMELDKSKADWHAESVAAAYAEMGNFDEAVRWQERALRNEELKSNDDARRRLELYRKKQAYRQD